MMEDFTKTFNQKLWMKNFEQELIWKTLNKNEYQLHLFCRVHENSGNYSAFVDPIIDQELAELLEDSPKHELSECELSTVREEEEEAPDTQAGWVG